MTQVGGYHKVARTRKTYATLSMSYARGDPTPSVRVLPALIGLGRRVVVAVVL